VQDQVAGHLEEEITDIEEEARGQSVDRLIQPECRQHLESGEADIGSVQDIGDVQDEQERDQPEGDLPQDDRFRMVTRRPVDLRLDESAFADLAGHGRVPPSAMFPDPADDPPRKKASA
jgi:hypothetical protein